MLVEFLQRGARYRNDLLPDKKGPKPLRLDDSRLAEDRTTYRLGERFRFRFALISFRRVWIFGEASHWETVEKVLDKTYKLTANREKKWSPMRVIVKKTSDPFDRSLCAGRTAGIERYNYSRFVLCGYARSMRQIPWSIREKPSFVLLSYC